MNLSPEIVMRVLRKAKILTGSHNSEAREDDLAIQELAKFWLDSKSLFWHIKQTPSFVEGQSVFIKHELLFCSNKLDYGHYYSKVVNDKKIFRAYIASKYEAYDEEGEKDFDDEMSARKWLIENAAKDGYFISA